MVQGRRRGRWPGLGRRTTTPAAPMEAACARVAATTCGPLPGERGGAGEADQVGRMDEQRAQLSLVQVGPEALVARRVDRWRGPAAGVDEHLERLAAGVAGVADILASPPATDITP